MERYEEYKASGLQFAPTVPKHWEIERIRFFGSLNAGGVDKKTEENEPLFKSVHYMDVYRGSLKEIFNSENYLVVSANETKAQRCTLVFGDVLFTASSETPQDIGHSCVVGETLQETLFGYHLMRFRPTKKADLHFEKYMYGADYMRKWFEYRAVGMTRYGISGIDFSDAPVIIPQLTEQKVIASYLDCKTTQIDGLIADKEKLIELLIEKRQSVISEAVTKGLDKSTLMKDSGVTWIGDIPTHWEMSKSRWLFGLRKNRAFPDDEQLTASQQYGIVNQKEYMNQGGSRVVQVITGADILKHVEPNDFVISMRSFQGGIEWSGIRGKISSAYVMLIPNTEKVYSAQNIYGQRFSAVTVFWILSNALFI